MAYADLGTVAAGGTITAERENQVDANFKVLHIPGMVVPYAGATVPSGWLLCDGQAVSRTGTYATLFAIIGTTYGTGNGTTTFNLPNLLSRVPVGKSADTNFNSLGKTGGATTDTLSLTTMPAHAHGTAGNMHSPWGSTYGHNWNGAHYFDTVVGGTDVQGGGQAHNNLQPYITLNYIIMF